MGATRTHPNLLHNIHLLDTVFCRIQYNNESLDTKVEVKIQNITIRSQLFSKILNKARKSLLFAEKPGLIRIWLTRKMQDWARRPTSNSRFWSHSTTAVSQHYNGRASYCATSHVMDSVFTSQSNFSMHSIQHSGLYMAHGHSFGSSWTLSCFLTWVR